MKKWKIFALLILLLPTMTLAGCKSESRTSLDFVKEYNIKTAQNSGLEASSVTGNIGGTSAGIKHFVIKKPNTISSIIDTNTKYKFITELYEPLILQALLPTYYISGSYVLTSSVSNKQNESVYTALDAMYNEVYSAVVSVDMMTRSFSMNEDAESISNLSRLKDVYIALERVLVSAMDLSQVMMNIYSTSIDSAVDYENMSLMSQADRVKAHKSVVWLSYQARYYVTEAYYYANMYGANVGDSIRYATGNYASIGALSNNTLHTQLKKWQSDPFGNATQFSDVLILVSQDRLVKGLSNYSYALNEYTADRQMMLDGAKVLPYLDKAVTLTPDQSAARASQEYYFRATLPARHALISMLISLVRA